MTVPQKVEKQSKPTLVYDSVHPSRLRSTDGGVSDIAGINSRGLDRISMSGIQQFSEAQLDEIVARVHPKTVVVIDTRQESHGFVSGEPVSWMALDNRNWANVDKEAGDILSKEEKKLKKFAGKFDGTTLHIPHGSTAKGKSQIEPLQVDVQGARVETEQQLVERKGGLYLRVPVPDHAAPSLDVLSGFSDATRNLVQEKGLDNLHFVVHCRGGMGRTTLFMSALDMLTNAPDVSAHEIVERQVKLRRRAEGSADTEGKAYKATFRGEKEAVMQSFHDYAADNSFANRQAVSLQAWADDTSVNAHEAAVERPR